MISARFGMLLLALGAGATQLNAFSLLGPYADWMDKTNGYRSEGDIGGPMELREEYRWNVPVITYGFDKSFVEFFGEEGIRAVESAIQILNDLQPASRIALTDFSPNVRRVNQVAVQLHLQDLKSSTLALLLEQLGLASPSHHIFVLKVSGNLEGLTESEWPEGTIPNTVLLRNYDPETLAPSRDVNGIRFTGMIEYERVTSYPVDPLLPREQSVADGLGPGDYCTGLSRDDVGGLRYLLSRTNVNLESLPPNARDLAGSSQAFRGGVEKIRFVRHPARRGIFKPWVSTFAGSAPGRSRGVVRQVSRPDILFTAFDRVAYSGNLPDLLPDLPDHLNLALMVERTATSNWVSCAANGSAENPVGPGIIRGPIEIKFWKALPHLFTYSDGATYSSTRWGSFSGSTNKLLTYPVGSNFGSLRIQMNSGTRVEWIEAPVRYGEPALLQYSTSSTNWITAAEIVNEGSVVFWDYFGSDPMHAQFRIVPADGDL